MNFLKNYNLSLVLFALFLISWIGQGYYQWKMFQSEQTMHGQEVKVEEFKDEFLQATFENWQSEFLQLLSFVVLTAFLIHKGSPESKDGDDKKDIMLEKIYKEVKSRKKK